MSSQDWSGIYGYTSPLPDRDAVVRQRTIAEHRTELEVQIRRTELAYLGMLVGGGLGSLDTEAHYRDLMPAIRILLYENEILTYRSRARVKGS
ncbi:MAG: hypothetical protein Q7U75_11830, partial [Desulfobacterales bacterium]|nr:hypothetical protein [Desulfobacterales bacterium]